MPWFKHNSLVPSFLSKPTMARNLTTLQTEPSSSKHGIHLRPSCPYTSQQNGKAERILRTLNDSMRCVLFQASMPLHFWADVLATATYLLNRRPCKATVLSTPYELLYGQAPSVEHLRVFGSLCFPNTTATAPHKLAARSIPCVFLGNQQTMMDIDVSIPCPTV